jgi:cytochrome c-type biogenesis protein
LEQPSLWVAFGAGLLSFVTPCVLPLVPVYLASLVGPELFTEKSGFRLTVLLHALSFVIGFGIIFTLWGAGAGLMGAALSAYLPVVRQVSGILLILFGAFLLASLKIPWLNFESRLAPSKITTIGYSRSLLTGAVFAVAWTPCVGPILAGILTVAVNSQTAAQGALLLAIYSAGLGLPFLLIGLAFNSLAPLLKRIQRYSTIIYICSGILLIAIGVLVITDNLTWLQAIK